MYSFVFLILSVLWSVQAQANCLFCPCQHSAESAIKKVERVEHVRDIDSVQLRGRCGLCLSDEHRTVPLQKCGGASRETITHLCQRCLHNNMLPASSYELLVNDTMSFFVCRDCEHDLGGHV